MTFLASASPLLIVNGALFLTKLLIWGVNSGALYVGVELRQLKQQWLLEILGVVFEAMFDHQEQWESKSHGNKISPWIRCQ